MLCENCFRKLNSGCDEMCCDLKIYLDIFVSPPATELPIDDSDILSTEDEDLEKTTWEYSKSEYNPATLKKLIIELHLDGLSVKDILYHLPCNKSYVYRIIQEFSTKS